MTIDTARGLGKAFYDRYYRNRRTRVVTQAEMTRRAALIVAFVQHVELPVRSILDAGCGLGLMRVPLLRGLPRARYTGLETSGYLCERYGWEQGSLATWKARRPFDLVVCYDVLQYLEDREAGDAMRALGRLCSGVLHFSALTLEDWRDHCDRRRTDRRVHMRSADWYRRRLRPDFINAGSGMFLRRGAPLHLWALERLSSAPDLRRTGSRARDDRARGHGT
jgi:predicted TPR repeat methyltransferase